MQDPLWGLFILLPEIDTRRLAKQYVLESAVALRSSQPWIQVSAPASCGGPEASCRAPWSPLSHLQRCSWNDRSSKVPTTRNALCMPVLSFCGWLTQLPRGGRGRDGTGGHNRCVWQAEAAICGRKGNSSLQGLRLFWEPVCQEMP